jgi:hypothetical protein
MTSKIQTVKLKLIKELKSKNFNFNKVRYLITLPDHLVVASLALHLYGESTADQISEKTSIPRAAISDYLNQLVRNRYATNFRVGRYTHFKSI